MRVSTMPSNADFLPVVFAGEFAGVASNGIQSRPVNGGQTSAVQSANLPISPFPAMFVYRVHPFPTPCMPGNYFLMETAYR